ncbi:hypothetical protein ACC732_37395, partial [Rhizobium ruizarguesonis]
EQMPEIIKSQRLIAISVPSNQKNVIESLAATIDGIKTIVQTPNPTDDPSHAFRRRCADARVRLRRVPRRSAPRCGS